MICMSLLESWHTFGWRSSGNAQLDVHERPTLQRYAELNAGINSRITSSEFHQSVSKELSG